MAGQGEEIDGLRIAEFGLREDAATEEGGAAIEKKPIPALGRWNSIQPCFDG